MQRVFTTGKLLSDSAALSIHSGMGRTLPFKWSTICGERNMVALNYQTGRPREDESAMQKTITQSVVVTFRLATYDSALHS